MDSPIFAGNPALDVLLAAGVRAVQSTPLVSRSGQMLGMFSTHYRVPRRPSESQLRMLDLLARLAADLIESRQAEERLRAKDTQLESITENTSVLLTHCSRDLRYIFVNRPYSEFLGKPRGELVGRPIVEVMGQEGFEIIRPFVDRVLRGEIVEFESEVPYESLGPRYMHARYVPDIDVNGEVIGWFASVADITERKESEVRIYDLMTELKDADRRKDEFLAVLAHELRNPLAPLRNMLEIMKRAEGNGDLLQQAQRTMERQLGQLVRLVDDLIDVNRINRDKIELRKERVELASTVHQAVEACQPLAEDANQQVTVTLPPDPIYIHADPVRLVQVFSNLLNNACKYSKRGDRIFVTAERQGSDVTVTVTDTGMGIPPDKLSTVFEMFTQVDRTLERSQGGLGIGLTLVKRLVGMHGGTVTARSEGAGRGSEFVVRLPVLIVQPQAETSQPISELGKTSARRILVVDDNTDAASSLARLLEITGNETQTAHDGLQALEAAEKFRPDVVLLDIGLPRLNGYDACRHIREQPWSKGMVLVALTGWGQDEDRRKSEEAGFDYHLIKPVDYAVLMKLLAEKQPMQV
jgi:PAS domain S-box-containing protein